MARKHGSPKRHDIAEQAAADDRRASAPARAGNWATWLERPTMSQGELGLPVLAGIERSRARCGRGSLDRARAPASNQSSAQLNGTGSGQRKPFTAAIILRVLQEKRARFLKARHFCGPSNKPVKLSSCEERSDEAIQLLGAAKAGIASLRSMTMAITPRKAANVLDNSVKVHAAMAGGVETP